MTSRTSFSGPWRPFAAALISISLMSVTACSGGETPPPGPPSSGSQSPPVESTPSASSTPSAIYKPADASGKAQNVPIPELPEAAKAKTKEGLEAFARYWYSLLNYAYETGDLSSIKSLSSPACALCGKVFPGIQKWNGQGRWIVGGTVAVHAVQSTFVKTPNGDFQVAIQSQQEAGSLENADGTDAQKISESAMLGDLMVARYEQGRWAVQNVDRLGS
ncbi:hypothetical protein C8D78_3895 [Arthrobacter oryzae]|uniref:DUF6318 domain-containing protein n=2 Tax=Arthrobacter oryzae TaxID=409290 RepID=A0A495E780_9MICC|nr:hypothetical protein C8D78_3895 [Arthrobacter oryzae]